MEPDHMQQFCSDRLKSKAVLWPVELTGWGLRIWIGVILALAGLNILPDFAFASDVPQSFTYQGRFYNAARTAPLSDVVDVVLGIYDPTGTCLLYEESQSNIDLTGTNGLFAVQVGSIQGDAKRVVGSDQNLTMA